MDDNNTNPLYVDPSQQVGNVLHFNEGTIVNADPLSLDIPDEDLIDIVDDRIETSQKFYEHEYNLSERRQNNEKYLFGRQVGEKEKKGKLKDYESRSSDNVLYEIESSLKPLALSKLPDMMVTPGGPDPERVQAAKDITMVVNDTNKKREQRYALGLGFKHLPVYFTAILKTRWNSEKGAAGDYEFLTVNPTYVVVDHTATSKNVDDMSYIAQCTPMTVQEVIMKFSEKKVEFYEELNRRGVMVGTTPDWKDLATEVKVWEVWFDWYKKKGDSNLFNKQDMQTLSLIEPGVTWEKVAGVLWKYEKCCLKKMLDPNFDHEGEDKLFSYDVPGDQSTKREVQPQDVLMSSMLGETIPNVKKEKVYHNYFKRPKKPYYLFGYDQWGKIAYDETSRIEQNIRNQQDLDDQKKEIMDQIKSRKKHVWGAESGLKKEDIQRLDMDDPKMDVRVNGDPNMVHKAIEAERPDQAQFQSINDTRNNMYALSGSFAIRGQQQSKVATTNQIGREADFSRSDDLVEDTINGASEWMAEWQMQFITLRYTDEHIKEITGPKGEMTYVGLRRDTAKEGMTVKIKSSATDKLKAQRNAMDSAKLGAPFTNPIDFFNDMDMSDPEGRAARGMMFSLDPQGFYVKYIMGMDSPAQAGEALTAGTPQPPQAGAGVQPNPSTAGQPPQQPTTQDTSQVATQPPAGPPQGSPRGL